MIGAWPSIEITGDRRNASAMPVPQTTMRPLVRTSRPGREAFYVIAKAPRPGFAKTRPGEGIGHEEAVALYGSLLRDLAARFSGSAHEPGWYVTPPDALPEMRPLIGSPRTVLFQGNSLARR